jgi:branched-chain amino acid transport system substrate-binding protein
MKYAILRTFAAGAILALGLSPAGVIAADQGVTDTEVVIGMFAPMSGQLAMFGVDPLQAASMLYDQVNKKGGIHGRKIRVVSEDDKCSPTEAVAVVKKLVTVDKVFALNGGSCTASTVAAQEFVTREKVPLVMLNAAGDAALFPPTRYVFGAFGGTQRAYGAIHMEFAVKHFNAKRIAYLAHDDDFGNSGWATAKATAERLGVQVVAVERFSPRITDVTAPMLNVRTANPDVIISAAYPAPGVLIAQKYAELKMTHVPLVQAIQGIPVPAAFAKNVANDAAFSNFFHSNPLNDLTEGPRQQKWLQQYKQQYPERTPGAFMAFGLPSAMVVMAALEKVGRNLTREAFIDALETTNFDTAVMAGTVAFARERRDALRSLTFVRFDGKTHTLIPGVFTWNGKDGM